MADLAARVAANDAEIERVNQKLPGGAKWMPNAEVSGGSVLGVQ